MALLCRHIKAFLERNAFFCSIEHLERVVQDIFHHPFAALRDETILLVDLWRIKARAFLHEWHKVRIDKDENCRKSNRNSFGEAEFELTVLIDVEFLDLGLVLFIHEELVEGFHRISALWRPNCPQNHNNNGLLARFDVVKSLLSGHKARKIDFFHQLLLKLKCYVKCPIHIKMEILSEVKKLLFCVDNDRITFEVIK